MSIYRLNKRKDIMLCYPFEEKRLAKWNPPYFIQPKLDGIRARAVKKEEGFVLLSSECNEIYSVPHILNELDRTLKDMPVGFELDGELYVHGWDFNSIESVVSRSVNFHPDAPLMHYHVFDLVTNDIQWIRLSALKVLNEQHFSDDGSLEMVPFHSADNMEGVMEGLGFLTEKGYEGIIVRHMDAPYVRKRSTFMMKWKPKKRDCYEIIGYKEEIDISGNPKNALGALECVGTDGTPFSVGSGFTRAQRELYWRDKEKLIGKMVLVSFQHLTAGRKVPRFPVFVEVI